MLLKGMKMHDLFLGPTILSVLMLVGFIAYAATESGEIIDEALFARPEPISVINDGPRYVKIPNDWVTVSNDEAQFSMKYPDNWPAPTVEIRNASDGYVQKVGNGGFFATYNADTGEWAYDEERLSSYSNWVTIQNEPPFGPPEIKVAGTKIYIFFDATPLCGSGTVLWVRNDQIVTVSPPEFCKQTPYNAIGGFVTSDILELLLKDAVTTIEFFDAEIE